MADSDEEADQDFVVSDIIRCEPCLGKNVQLNATDYCDQCAEYLCSSCVQVHTLMKATNTHTTLRIEEKIKRDRKLCDICHANGKEKDAINYCEICTEYLCKECTTFHKTMKATKLHTLIAKDLFNKIDSTEPNCNPCEEDKKVVRSSLYCKECEEFLCEDCAQIHRTIKITRSHLLIQASQMVKGKEIEAVAEMCEPCQLQGKESKAKSYCSKCNENLCNICADTHRNQRLTKLHDLINIEDRQHKESIKCEPCGEQHKTEIAVKYCGKCREYLCQNCVDQHKVQKLTRSHQLDEPHFSHVSIINCTLCLEQGEHNKAVKYCIDCEDYLCNKCFRFHVNSKVSKSHTLSEPGDAETSDPCDICKDSTNPVPAGVGYCKECSQMLCSSCSDRHSRQKLTAKHEIVLATKRMDMSDMHEWCEPCKHGGTQNVAVGFCRECENELLCEMCISFHERQTVTRTHVILRDLSQRVNYSAEDRIQNLCANCRLNGQTMRATGFCQDCGNDLLCDRCITSHQGQNRTKSHNISKDMSGLNGMGKLDMMQTIQRKDEALLENRDAPGQPKAADVGSDTVTLSWDRPRHFVDHSDYFQLSLKDTDNNSKWRVYNESFPTATACLKDLKSNTKFVFRVRVVREDSESPYSPVSEDILTEMSPAARVAPNAHIEAAGKPSPSKYALPLTEVRAARNEKSKTRKFNFGAPQPTNNRERTIMLIGATGTGKSTLVDGLVNYILGVNFDDPFRFTIINLEEEEKQRLKNQAFSQTEWITTYTIHPEKGSRLNYMLNIIDTPGFGDTRGLDRDQEIVDQIRGLFSEGAPKGVAFIDAVCFLIKAPDARLTAVQSYIFQSVMSLFGKDIENNICSFITFADGLDPPVLAALNESGLPFGKSFTFNNSGLFAKNVDLGSSSLSPMFWDMGVKSFRDFFRHLDHAETKSLQLTKIVLDERDRLQSIVRNLQPKLDAGLAMVNQLKQEIKILKDNHSAIEDNKNFTYEVSETRHNKKELLPGRHTTNCTHCNFTCHEDCVYGNDEDKKKCSAMDPSGKCKHCPDKCSWDIHANTPYVFEFVEVKVQKTYAEKQKKYRDATGKVPTQEKILEKMTEELAQMIETIEDMMETMKECNERLAEIALRPNPLSMTEHIDLMIENEKMTKKERFMDRIKTLNEFRKRAEIATLAEKFNKQASSTMSAAGRDCHDKDKKSIFKRIVAVFGI